MAFNDCKNLTAVTIGSSVETIGLGAFSRTKITSVIIPDSVITISDGVFFNCSELTTVTIGSGVTSVGAQAFSMCQKLRTVTFRRNNPPTIGAMTFFNGLDPSPVNTVRVPVGTTNAYRTALTPSGLDIINIAFVEF